jgi:hypothetical protein
MTKVIKNNKNLAALLAALLLNACSGTVPGGQLPAMAIECTSQTKNVLIIGDKRATKYSSAVQSQITSAYLEFVNTGDETTEETLANLEETIRRCPKWDTVAVVATQNDMLRQVDSPLPKVGLLSNYREDVNALTQRLSQAADNVIFFNLVDVADPDDIYVDNMDVFNEEIRAFLLNTIVEYKDLNALDTDGGQPESFIAAEILKKL